MSSITLPSAYGYVVLGAAVLPFITGMMLGGEVMKAREKFDVQYPNLYATPGFHKNADAFNRVQRGHQNYLEGLPVYMITTLLGGLKHPIPCAVGSVCFCIGSFLYQIGYSDTTLDAKMARHKKGGPIKYIGILTSFFCCISFAYTLIMSD